MGNDRVREHGDSHDRLEKAYTSEKPRFLARLRAAGRTLEEAEDIVHDVYAETVERLHLVADIANLPAWINTLFTRRLIDAWRHERCAPHPEKRTSPRRRCGRSSAVSPGPQDGFIRDSLGMPWTTPSGPCRPPSAGWWKPRCSAALTFRELAEATGESIDTLMARKRYALRNLTRSLRHWIEE